MSGGAVVAALAAALALVAFCALAWEAVRLARHEPPITAYTRLLVRGHMLAALVLGGCGMGVMGALFAHFVWDAACPTR